MKKVQIILPNSENVSKAAKVLHQDVFVFATFLEKNCK